MYRLKDLYSEIIKKPLLSEIGIACEKVDSSMAVLNRLMTDRCSMYSFNLVITGWAKIIYCGKEITIEKNDILIFTPGATIYTQVVSDDYYCWCLMCDESTTYGIPFARKIIAASYYPVLTHNECKFSMNDTEASVLAHRMEEIHYYLNSGHCYKDDILQSLYSVFVLELLNIENSYQPLEEVNHRSIDIFLRFLKLVNENFITQHELGFYADSLAITSIYLSRIVKRLSNMTIKNHIDRLLTMEACHRLSSTDTPIMQITMDLNFANPASFSKFFTRHKGLSPREYRNKF